MKGGTQAALALGVGYLLGRRRKMRLATMLAVGAATGGAGSLTSAAVKRGVKMLGSTEAVGKFAPQLGELADTVRSDLMDAGKAAATAALTSRIESLTDSLQERAEMVRDPAGAASSAGKSAGSAGKSAGKAARTGAGKAARTAAGVTRRARRGQDEAPEDEVGEVSDEEAYADDLEEPDGYDEPEAEAEEPEAEAEEPEAEAEEPEDEEPDGEEPEPAPVRRRAPRRRSPVARAGR